MTYTDFEIKLTDILKKHGWINSYSKDRTDSYIIWTEYGEGKLKDFLEKLKLVYNYTEDEKQSLLIPFCYYHGILKRTEQEQAIENVKRWITEDNFLVITCSKGGFKTYNFFQSKDDKNAYAIMEEANNKDEEVVIIEMSSLQNSNVGKLTPYGARGYYTSL
jgi:hypothetical protein